MFVASEENHPEKNVLVSSELGKAVNILVFKGLATMLLHEAERLELVTESNIDFYDEVRQFECRLIERALSATGGNQLAAARLLGLKKSTLHAKIKLYNISTKTIVEPQTLP